MAEKGKRLGRDPLQDRLGWIGDSRKGVKAPRLKPQAQEKPKGTVSGSSRAKLSEGWTRATFIVREELLEKFKDLAYTERRQKKELMDEILSSYLKGKRTIKRPKTEG